MKPFVWGMLLLLIAIAPLTSEQAAASNVSLAPNEGRLISYIPGWLQPPSAERIAEAGYTHIIVAFAVFSTAQPGNIVTTFDAITPEYIQELHQAGLKVLLSIGGAATNLPKTTVNFHQVLNAATSPLVFQQTFIDSLKQVQQHYDFDGFDFDIENGLIAAGSFSQPQGDIAILARIINTLHADNPEWLLSLTPQVANISATSGFDATWGNYASLIMQTYPSLSWVGIQLYNTGCAYGIDLICYDPLITQSPNFSVAMATDLLTNWPTKLLNGTFTGFQPYISYLSPSQIVLGYPAPDANGGSDGAPVTPISTILRALRCLKTAVANKTSCDTFVPPQAYGPIGGVFNWEITYDQNNNFRFAQGLRNCVRYRKCD